MALTIEQFQRLKKEVGALKEEADKAQGALEQQLIELKKQFGCDNIADAEVLLKELTIEEEEAEKEFQAAYDSFRSNWGELLKL